MVVMLISVFDVVNVFIGRKRPSRACSLRLRAQQESRLLLYRSLQQVLHMHSFVNKITICQAVHNIGVPRKFMCAFSECEWKRIEDCVAIRTVLCCLLMFFCSRSMYRGEYTKGAIMYKVIVCPMKTYGSIHIT